MKKGLVIGVVIVVALLGFLATHPPSRHKPGAGTETAEQLAASSPSTVTEKTIAPARNPVLDNPVSTPVFSPVATEVPAPVPQPAATSAVQATPINTPDIDVPLAMQERILGKDDAPVTVIEYASLTCPHCAHFATEVLPEIKTKLIDTGRMRLIFRDFPLDQVAMKAAKMARCASHDKYYDLIEVIFKNRERWLASKEPENALMQLGALTGMEDSYMKSCVANVELDNGILKGVSEAQTKFSLQSTPTFIFNYGAETLSGGQDEAKFEEVVNRLTAGKR
jgi:protein-disulfide isomerase